MGGQSDQFAFASAPASSANLGPGFDALALAFELRCECRAAPADAWSVEELDVVFTPGRGELVRLAAVAAVGEKPVHLRIDNAIPRSRGLGSSSAVAVAIAAAATRAYGGEPTSEQLFAIAAELEGHPDNAAAAVYGGLVAASGDVMRQLPLHSSLVFLVAIPDEKLSTRDARNALPSTLSHATAARSVARVAMLIDGLRTGDPETLRTAAGDELHEAPRAGLSPLTADLIATAYQAGAFHAAWSGAGPAALAIVDEAGVHAVSQAMKERLGDGGTVQRLAVATDGWR